jgi:hypothetical protein
MRRKLVSTSTLGGNGMNKLGNLKNTFWMREADEELGRIW